MSTGQAGAEIGIGIWTTLNCNHEAPIVAIQDGRGLDKKQNGLGLSETDCSYTLDSVGGQAVAYTLHGADKTISTATETELAGSIRTKPPGSIENSSTTVALQQMQVRRLTPAECEALQGFPRGYTDIPGAADGPRYKALGNSMAVPVMRWIGERICRHL